MPPRTRMAPPRLVLRVMKRGKRVSVRVAVDAGIVAVAVHMGSVLNMVEVMCVVTVIADLVGVKGSMVTKLVEVVVL